MIEYLNTLVVHCLDIVKYKGISEDADDTYYVYETLNKGVFESSIVIDFIPLIDFLPKEKYEKLENFWNLNYKEKFNLDTEVHIDNNELELIKEDIATIKNFLNINYGKNY